jgi:hypothetical protein
MLIVRIGGLADRPAVGDIIPVGINLRRVVRERLTLDNPVGFLA